MGGTEKRGGEAKIVKRWWQAGSKGGGGASKMWGWKPLQTMVSESNLGASSNLK